ncbi:hypothetical protein [Pseudoalteromonas spongiae]|uniref:hypothetical protein n=1 Tax=Pseudoalteromonas spongiae TaxID=298657 RepID=UPI000C2D5535|nr:hypothetical protein [Pseudoalteromonas spongiae]
MRTASCYYYSQGELQRSKRSALKRRDYQVKWRHVIYGFIHRIAGMGTMFAVNELIKTNKMVRRSTKAAIKASESLLNKLNK